MAGYGDERWGDRGTRNDYRSDFRGGRESRDDDRGFMDRAGDEVRSWFGDEEAQRRREADERRWEHEQRLSGRRGNDYRDNGRYESAGTGWGNQSGASWHRDRPGRSGWGGARSEVEYDGGFGRSDRYSSDRGEASGRGLHDPHYEDWRRRQIEGLDRDYDEYRREHQSKFEQEFGSWRSKRQGQRQALGRVGEHMDVVGADGSHVGTVDKVRGDRIVLTRSDPDSGGIHHSIPCAWVENVDGKVMLNKSADEARQAWRDEEQNRAFFDRDGRGTDRAGDRAENRDGPHNLNRSFSGTYSERDE